VKNLCWRFALVAVCLLLFPAASFADAVVMGPCGNINTVGNANGVINNCNLAGGGTAQYGGQGTAGVNTFTNIASPVVVTGLAGQINVITVTVTTNPNWTVAGPVSTSVTLTCSVTINGPGATVDVAFTGRLGGLPNLPATGVTVSHHFAASDPNFSMTVSGDQLTANVATASMVVLIVGPATFTSPGSGEFTGQVPEPATLFLFGTGLTGMAMKMRRRWRK